MLTGLVIIAVVFFLGVLSHRKSKLEERIFKNVPLSDWILLVFLPIFTYVGWFILVRGITGRPSQSIIPFDDVDVLSITILFIIYAFAGSGIHFTSKILSRHIKSKSTEIYRINEMFHGKFSHYLTYLNGFFIAFMLAVLEINHPLSFFMLDSYMLYIITAGIIMGLSARKAVFFTDEWFGGFNKPIFFVVLFLQSLAIFIFNYYRLNINFYPINLFVSSVFITFLTTFLIRQILIFTNLDEKRRLQFLNRIFSV